MTDRRLPFLRFIEDDPANPNAYPKSWTVLQRRRMALNVHPATGLPFARDGKTCESCGSCYGTSHQSSRVFYKCRLAGPPTHGPGSDIRLGWPACREYVTRQEI